jgi:WD40 repeat protein
MLGALVRLGKGPVRETVLSPDAKRLAVSGDLGVYLYRTDTLEEIWFQPMPAGAHAVHALVFSPDGTQVAAGYFPNPLTSVWDAESGQEMFSVVGHWMGICAVAFSPDGARIATGSYDNQVMIWDANTGDHLDVFEGDGSGINGLAYSADGTQLIVGLDTISVWALDANSYEWNQSLRAGQ